MCDTADVDTTGTDHFPPLALIRAVSKETSLANVRE